MSKASKTKSALISSVIALVLCFTMLLGTTFAWFTDSASTSVNKIQAGTLKVDIVDENGDSLQGKTLNFVKAAGHEDEEILWEPGCTYKLPEIRIVNNGNLALKCKIFITGIDGDAELNNVIDWTIETAGETYSADTELHLAEKESVVLSLSGTMQTTADNYYQGKSMDGITITVYATQDTVEYDSEDNQYDKDATWYINKSNNKNGTVYSGEKVTLDTYLVEHKYNGNQNDGKAFYLYKGAELTLNNIDFSTTVENDEGKRHIGFYLYSGSKLTINGGNYTMDGKWDVLIWAQGGTNGERCTVTINGGNFKIKNAEWNSVIVTAYSGYGYCGSDVYITGGFFDLSEGNPNVTLQWKNDSTMTVTGGTFVNYNPADHGAVPSGYKVESNQQSDGKVWYTVVPENN